MEQSLQNEQKNTGLPKNFNWNAECFKRFQSVNRETHYIKDLKTEGRIMLEEGNKNKHLTEFSIWIDQVSLLSQI